MKKFLHYIDRDGNIFISNDYENTKTYFLYNTFFGRIILFFMTRRIVSKLVGAFLSTRISTIKINSFIDKNVIDMSTYEVKKYKSFNDFFTRKKDPKYLDFKSEDSDFLSPCDAKLEVFNISDDLVLDIKNSKYHISDLLKDEEVAKKYNNGLALVFRLTVSDYHRYIYIDDGNVLAKKHIKGRLNTVRPIAVRTRRVYTENAREWMLLKTKNFGNICQIEVGAMCVGKIKNHDVTTFKKYDEKGLFLFGGSTIVMLLENNKVKIDDDIIYNTKNQYETIVKVGMKIGKCYNE